MNNYKVITYQKKYGHCTEEYKAESLILALARAQADFPMAEITKAWKFDKQE